MSMLKRGAWELYADERGSGDPPLVFVHGWGGTHADFLPQIEHFARSHRVVAVDLPGHGRSRRTGAYEVESLADDVMAVCARLLLTEPVLVGHSVGGTIVLDAAARYRDAVGGLVMIDPVILFPPPVLEAFRPAVEALRTPAWASVFRGFIESWTDDAAERDRRSRQAEEMDQDVIASIGEHGLTYIGERSGASVELACGIPMLYIGGNQPVDVGRLRRLCPSAEVETMPGAGHYIQLQRADDITILLKGFLQTIAAGSRSA